MKALIMVLALSLTTVAANAELDVTTCNSDLIKSLSAMKKPLSKDQIGALGTVTTIHYHKFQALTAASVKMQTQIKQTQAALSEIIDIRAQEVNAAMLSSKLSGQTSMLLTVTEEIKSFQPCITLANQLLKK